MSYISASRIPHAYAETDSDETVSSSPWSARDVVSRVPRGPWMFGAIGVGAIGAIGAALYASLRSGAPAPRKRRAHGRKPTTRRAKAAA